MDLRGVHVPVTTPFQSDGSLDLSGLARNVTELLAAGVAGVVVLGTTGEAALLDEDESDRVIDTARRAAPAALLIAGVGRESTRATALASDQATDLGADALLVRTPSTYRARMDDESLAAHYLTVAETARRPILLYSFAGATGVRIGAPLAVRLAHQQPRIVGIKESDPDVAQVGELARLAPSGFAVLAGSASTFLASLAVGAIGGILALANLAPRHCLALHAHAAAGRAEDALMLQRSMAPLARLLGSHGVPGLKAALDGLGRAGGPPRPPLRPAPPVAAAEILAALAALPAIG